jgi:hypothetical protein
MNTASSTSDLATHRLAPTTNLTNIYRTKLHVLRKRGAVRYQLSQPASELLNPLLPLAQIDRSTTLCDCYTLQAMGGLAGPTT